MLISEKTLRAVAARERVLMAPYSVFVGIVMVNAEGVERTSNAEVLHLYAAECDELMEDIEAFVDDRGRELKQRED